MRASSDLIRSSGAEMALQYYTKLDWDSEAFLYAGTDQSLDVGHPGNWHVFLELRQSLKELKAFQTLG